MWLFTRTGFFSIVQHDDSPARLMVRARAEEDLLDLREALALYSAVIIEDAKADYRWRMAVPRQAMAEWLVSELAEVDYTTSVKDRIDKNDPLRHRALMDVWSSMYALQLRESRHAGKDYVDPELWSDEDD